MSTDTSDAEHEVTEDETQAVVDDVESNGDVSRSDAYAESDDDTGDGDDRLVEEGEIAGDYLEQLLDLLDFDGDIDLDVDGDRAVVSIDGGRDLGKLVGKEPFRPHNAIPFLFVLAPVISVVTAVATASVPLVMTDPATTAEMVRAACRLVGVDPT